MKHAVVISKKNLRQLAWKGGYHGVSGVARAIGRSQQSVEPTSGRAGDGL